FQSPKRAALTKGLAMASSIVCPLTASAAFSRTPPSPPLEPSWLLLFALNPSPDVRRTIAKGDAVALARPQEPNSLAIHQDDVLEIEHDRLAARFSGQ